MRTFRAVARVELVRTIRSPALGLLTLLAAVNFLVGMSLFGLTGSHAPTAIVNEGGGKDVPALISALRSAHRSFTILPMSAAEAASRLQAGTLVAEIIIPKGFTKNLALSDGRLTVAIDNVNTDQTEDVERALPSALLGLGRSLHLHGVRLHVREHDLLRRDTDYIPYLTVSSLALVCLVLGGILGALAVTREFEADPEPTWKLWRLAPADPGTILVAKVLAASVSASVAVAVALTLVVAVYGVVPQNWPLVLATLELSIVVSCALGALVGTAVRRTAAVVPLVFGAAMPLYIISGALEPVRFDGNGLWIAAHPMPTYYSVGLLEYAFHGLQVTPEPVWIDGLSLMAFAVVSIAVASRLMFRVAR